MKRYRDTIILVFSSIVLYQFDVLYILFIIPLHIIGLVKDKKTTLYAVCTVSAVIFFEEFFRLNGIEVKENWLLLSIGFFTPISLLIASAIYFAFTDLRKVFRFCISLSPAAVGGFFLLQAYQKHEELALLLKNLFGEFYYSFMTNGNSVNNSIVDSNQTLLLTEQLETIVQLSESLIQRGFLPMVMILLGVSIMLSEIISQRKLQVKKLSLTNFRLPEIFLWPSLVLWAVMLIDTVTGFQNILIIIWNLGLCCLVLYAVQGVSIIYFIGEKKRVGGGRRSVVLILLLLLFPGMNVLVMIIIPILGISELWVKYRLEQDLKESLDEDNT